MNLKKKARFRREHEPEIMLYEAATRELKKLLSGKPVPSEKKTYVISETASEQGILIAGIYDLYINLNNRISYILDSRITTL